MCESKSQKKQRISIEGWGSTWSCGHNQICTTTSYVYLGVTLKPDLDFTTHIEQLQHKLQLQKREAAMLGVHAGGMPPDLACRLWQAYVEPKFAYACGIWMHETNAKAHSVINRVQCNGARQLLGFSDIDEAVCAPPPCAALLETQLKPAHILRVMGLLRFWRIVLSRPKQCMLRRVWDVIESHHSTSHPMSLNLEVRSLQQKHPISLGTSVPNPKNKPAWKELINGIAKTEMNTWVAEHDAKGGRAHAYCLITHKHMADKRSDTPAYLQDKELRPNQRRNIALMRTQAAAYVAAHAQHRAGTALYGPAVGYGERYCTQQSCKRRRIVDSTEHVMLKCPSHEPARQAMVTKADAALTAAAIGAPRGSNIGSLAAAGSDARQLQVLLGSPPPLSINGDDKHYSAVLQASADFIREVYDWRWVDKRTV